MFNLSGPEKNKFKNSTKTLFFLLIELIPRIGKKHPKNLTENVAPNAILHAFLKNCQRNQHFYFQKKTSLEHSLFGSIFFPLESTTIRSLDTI